MKFEMKVDKLPLGKIINGTKKIEIRLFDHKRKKIKLWDEITFMQNDNLVNVQKVKVIWLLKYNSFKELFDNHLELFGWDTKKILIEEIYNFYSKEKEKQYWVLWIHIELI